MKGKTKSGARSQPVPEPGDDRADTHEPDTFDKNLECPPELPPLARQEWDRIVGELTVLGILSRFDRGPLAVYCGAYFLWAEAMDALHKYGTMIKSPNGYPVPSPYLATLNRQAEVMMRLAGEFGFTPAARSRNFS